MVICKMPSRSRVPVDSTSDKLPRYKEKGRSEMDRPAKPFIQSELRSSRFGSLLLGGTAPGRMIRNRLHLVFIDRLRAGFGEVGSGGNQPVIGRGRATAASTGLDAAWVDRLLGFTARQIGFGVNRTF